MRNTHTAGGGWRLPAWTWVVFIGWLLAMPATAKTYATGGYHFDVAPAPGWVMPRSVPTRWPASAPGATGESWRYWLFDSQVDRRKGRREIYVDRAYEADSADLVRQAGKYEINFNPNYQTLTLHRVELRRHGKWQQRLKPASVTLARRESDFDSADMSTGEVTALIVLDDVQPGDVVRISYTVSGGNPILAGMEAELFSMSWYQPMLERHVRLWWDPGQPLDVRRSPGVPAPRITQQRDGELVSLDASAVAAVYNEGSYPNWYSPTAWLNVAARRSWSDVASWARGLYPPPAPLPGDLKRRIAQWKALPNVDRRIAAALRAVQEEVRYFGVELGDSSHRPAEPALTWQRRYGDCKDKARLLATVLGQMGIEAYPALVSARQGRGVHDWPPSPNAFDHVIVQVRLPETTLWLDATQTQQRDPVRALSRDTLGTALPVAPDTRGLVDLQRQSSAIDHIRIREHFVPDPRSSAMTLDIVSEFRGTVAESLRQRLRSGSADDLARAYADYYRRRFGSVQGRAPVVSDDPRTGVLRVVEHYRLANPWSQAPGRGLDVYPGTLGGYVTLPRVGQREAPLELGVPVEVDYQTRVAMRPGWRWSSPPDTGSWKDGAIAFDYRIARVGSEVQLDRHYRSLAESVSAADFPAHFALLRKIGEELSMRLSFGATSGAPDAASREQRLQDLLHGLIEKSDARGR